MRFGGIAFLHRHDIVAGLGVEFDHLLHAAHVGLHDHVGEEQREGLVADQVARAPHRVAEAERHLLACVGGLAGRRLQPLEAIELLGFSALLQRIVEFELDVEMILDDRLVASGHEDEVLYARLTRLVDHILDHRLVDHGDHFLRDCLGRRQEAGSQSRYREDGLANFSHAFSGWFGGSAMSLVVRFR